jgi:lipopolysaccharide/colanic/teichoic acid biosynthesis glycosyltransferase
MKHIFDLDIILIGLLLLVPIIILVAALVRLKLGSAIFFKQARPGSNGELFNMYKFRSMTNECDKDGNLLNDEVRLTEFDKFLRSTGLDELPGLWNVLKGDMSLVGASPLVGRIFTFVFGRAI